MHFRVRPEAQPLCPPHTHPPPQARTLALAAHLGPSQGLPERPCEYRDGAGTELASPEFAVCRIGLRTSGPCPCGTESMDEQEEKPPETLTEACVQDSLLPQEIIIKVEREDSGPVAVPSQTWQLHLEEENQHQSRELLMMNHPME
ncbi:zinc finger protein 180 isoform X12 [Myotis daubentonii]|uniref:zinc finger protein 180 isoform X12 n=1 Tax=Myotis daubentonii TaxID=98922 RepID=UPI002872EB96|nr:zinc finger protein 180 isoform X12 [Myotis daubentonii]